MEPARTPRLNPWGIRIVFPLCRGGRLTAAKLSSMFHLPDFTAVISLHPNTFLIQNKRIIDEGKKAGAQQAGIP